MSVFLKVKVKSLAAESKIIRLEERRTRSRDIRIDLAVHRRGIVRREARHSLLALGYLRGTPYRRMEAKCHEAPNWAEVERMVKRYGPPKHNTGFDEWRKQPRSPDTET